MRNLGSYETLDRPSQLYEKLKLEEGTKLRKKFDPKKVSPLIMHSSAGLDGQWSRKASEALTRRVRDLPFFVRTNSALVYLQSEHPWREFFLLSHLIRLSCHFLPYLSYRKGDQAFRFVFSIHVRPEAHRTRFFI